MHLFLFFITSVKWQFLFFVRKQWQWVVQQSSAELKSEMFTPVTPLYFLSSLRSTCFHGSFYFAPPQDHPVSSVCILLPTFHRLSTVILQQTIFKKLCKERCERHRRNFKPTAAFVSWHPLEFHCLLSTDSFTLLVVYETTVVFKTGTNMFSVKQTRMLKVFWVYYGLFLFLFLFKHFKNFINSVQVTWNKIRFSVDKWLQNILILWKNENTVVMLINDDWQ